MANERSKQHIVETTDLRPALGNGQRLSIQLRPNHDALEIETPEYDEAYALPFVFCEGDVAAGLTRTGHYQPRDEDRFETISFSYNTVYPYYSIHFPTRFDRVKNQIVVKLMSKLQYRVYDFKLADPARMIFETTAESGYTPQDHGLTESIQSGRTHFITLGFPGERVWSLPVDISYDYFPTGDIEFRTETVLAPKHVMMPATFHTQLQTTNAQVIDAMTIPNASVDLFLPADLTYLKILANGRCFTADGQASDTPMTYEYLRVFEYP